MRITEIAPRVQNSNSFKAKTSQNPIAQTQDLSVSSSKMMNNIAFGSIGNMIDVKTPRPKDPIGEIKNKIDNNKKLEPQDVYFAAQKCENAQDTKDLLDQLGKLSKKDLSDVFTDEWIDYGSNHIYPGKELVTTCKKFPETMEQYCNLINSSTTETAYRMCDCLNDEEKSEILGQTLISLTNDVEENKSIDKIEKTIDENRQVKPNQVYDALKNSKNAQDIKDLFNQLSRLNEEQINHATSLYVAKCYYGNNPYCGSYTETRDPFSGVEIKDPEMAKAYLKGMKKIGKASEGNEQVQNYILFSLKDDKTSNTIIDYCREKFANN